MHFNYIAVLGTLCLSGCPIYEKDVLELEKDSEKNLLAWSTFPLKVGDILRGFYIWKLDFWLLILLVTFQRAFVGYYGNPYAKQVGL